MAALRMLFLAFLVAFGASASRADELPACTAASAGIVACIAERLCRCAFQRGGSMVDREPGHRWDCGPLRPSCHRPPTTLQRAAPPFTDLDVVVPLREAIPWRNREAMPSPRPRPSVHPRLPAADTVR